MQKHDFVTDQSQIYKTSPKLRFDFMVRAIFAKKERLKKTNLLKTHMNPLQFSGNGNGMPPDWSITKAVKHHLTIPPTTVTTSHMQNGLNRTKKHNFQNTNWKKTTCDETVTEFAPKLIISETTSVSRNPENVEKKTQINTKKNIKRGCYNNNMDPEEFFCNLCNYRTDRNWTFQRHQLSNKHLKNAGLMCSKCGKKYSTKSGLWKHQKKSCERKKRKKEPRKKTPSIKSNEDLIQAVVQSVVGVFQQQQQQQAQFNEKIIGTMNQIIPKIGNNNTTTTNNTVNQKISIKVFLNKHCKNAVDLRDFIENIQLSFANLKDACVNGGAAAISDVLVQKLTDMKPTERPIHCSDAKRSHFYVKDKGEWARDNNTKKIDKAITLLAKKQFDALYQWQQEHPDWIHNERLSNQYLEMTQQIAWTAEEARKNKRKIKQSLTMPLNIKEAIQESEADNI